MPDMRVDKRKRSACGRKVIDKHGDTFLSPSDKSLHTKTEWAYRLGVAGMLLSFPISFHFSRRIASNKARAGKYLM